MFEETSAVEVQTDVADPARSPKVAVVIVDFNGLEDTLKCLDSMRSVEYPQQKTILVDNGSSTPVKEPVESSFPDVDILVRQENGGWAGGNNAGIERALAWGAEYVLLLNNDTIVDPQLIDRLVAAAQRSPEYGVLGTIICFMDEPTVVNTDGCLFNHPQAGFFHRQEVPYSERPQVEITETEIVNGCCMLISGDVFEKIGLIDDRFFLIHEESDFCLRAGRAGFRCGIVGETLVWHKGSSSFQREAKPLQAYFDARNLYLILRKHNASYQNGPGRFRSWVKYVKHVYYMYCLQRDRGNEDGAQAVLSGMYDGLTGRYGPLVARRRLFLPLLASVFGVSRRWRSWRNGASTTSS